MRYPTIWHWRFEIYSDDQLREWIRRVEPGQEGEADLAAIDVLAGRVVAKDAAVSGVTMADLTPTHR